MQILTLPPEAANQTNTLSAVGIIRIPCTVYIYWSAAQRHQAPEELASHNFFCPKHFSLMCRHGQHFTAYRPEVKRVTGLICSTCKNRFIRFGSFVLYHGAALR